MKERREFWLAMASLGLSVLLVACVDKGNQTPTLAPAAPTGAATPGSGSICGEKSLAIAQLTKATDYTPANSPVTAGVRAVAFTDKAVLTGFATKPGEAGGLVAFTGKDWRVCTDKPTQVNDIAVDGKEIWLATDPQRNIANESVGGPWRYDGRDWTNYPDVDRRGYAVAMTKDRVLYGAWDGAFNLAGNIWEKAFPDLHLPQIHSIFVRPESKETWFGKLDKGVEVDKGTMPPTSDVLIAPGQLGGNNVRHITGTADGKIVAVGTDGVGVTLYENGKTTIINSKTTPGALDNVSSVAFEPGTTQLWVADYKGGVGHYDYKTGKFVSVDLRPAYSLAVCAPVYCPNEEFTGKVVIGGVDPRLTIISTSAPVAGSANAVRIPTAVVKEATPTLPEFKFTKIEVQDIIKGEQEGIIVDTQGRDVGTTIRVTFFKSRVDKYMSQKELEREISIGVLKEDGGKELGVPRFNSDTGSLDWPIWNIGDYPPGWYPVMIEARPLEAKGNWNDPSVIRQTVLVEVRH